jgi:hypothetical protein
MCRRRRYAVAFQLDVPQRLWRKQEHAHGEPLHRFQSGFLWDPGYKELPFTKCLVLKAWPLQLMILKESVCLDFWLSLELDVKVVLNPILFCIIILMYHSTYSANMYLFRWVFSQTDFPQPHGFLHVFSPFFHSKKLHEWLQRCKMGTYIIWCYMITWGRWELKIEVFFFTLFPLYWILLWHENFL